MSEEKKLTEQKDELLENEELFTGDEDEEILNCEGGPCNFVIKEN